ncbi:MAG: tRNA epoxyqueuosine(34) reductase QueG, partial [Neisseriaceae bacterium]|nr:tRNA epoxyqueuosine(34) reductase QueG [Neisseriaceae bacterium]
MKKIDRLEKPILDQNLVQTLVKKIKAEALLCGFNDVAISSANLPNAAAEKLIAWLAAGYHGRMAYMENHGLMRVRPKELVDNTLSIITVRLDYFTPKTHSATLEQLDNRDLAYISRYSLGRDYHKVMRQKLKQLAAKITTLLDNSPVQSNFSYRVFTDSAPVAEVALASLSGLGWRGKHTLLVNKKAGSFFFLGELFTNLPLPADTPTKEHCGDCTRCIDACPTQAIIAPYTVDARRCLSYLTIENQTEIVPEPFRRAMGNRIYGCDDCQLVCPWNKFTPNMNTPDFKPRHQLDTASLIDLFAWTEAEFAEAM